MAERCPTCGSGKRERDTGISYCCTDPWHGVASEPAPTPPVWDECVGSHDEAEPAATPEQPIHQQNCAVFWNEPCNCGIEWKVPIKAEPAPTDIDHCPKCGEYLHDEMGHMCAAEPAVERPTEHAKQFHENSGIAIPLYATMWEGNPAIPNRDEILAVVYKLMTAFTESELSSLREKLRLFGLRESDLNAVTREELAEKYKAESGKKYHTSDCATSVAPAEAPGPCDCISPALNDPELTVRDLTVAELESELSSLRRRLDEAEDYIETQFRKKHILPAQLSVSEAQAEELKAALRNLRESIRGSWMYVGTRDRLLDQVDKALGTEEGNRGYMESYAKKNTAPQG